MRVLLRDFRTGLYLGRGRVWTRNPERARTFSNRFRAKAYKVCHHLREAAVVAISAVAFKSARSGLERKISSADGRAIIVQAEIELRAGSGLFIRGEGETLDWRHGQPLTQSDKATWIWSVDSPSEPILFQLLLDDLIWAKGENIALDLGARVELVPDFEWPEIPRVSYTDPVQIHCRIH